MKNKFKELKEKFIAFNNTTYGMLIVVSWVVLLICLVIKLFGGNWFELWWDNEKFISFCNYVENTMWLKMSIACVISLTSTLPIIAIIYNININKFKTKHIILYSFIIIIKSLIGWSVPLISTILDFIILLIIPFIITKNWKRILLVNVFILALQLISILIRNISFGLNFNNTLIETYLIQVDYYIMLILLYLYNFRRKELN